MSKPRARTSHPPRRRSPIASDAVTHAAPHTTKPRAQSTHMTRSEAQPRTVRRTQATNDKQKHCVTAHHTQPRQGAEHPHPRPEAQAATKARDAPHPPEDPAQAPSLRAEAQPRQQHNIASHTTGGRRREGWGGAQWEAGRSTRRGRRRRVRLTGGVKARSPHSTKAEVRQLGKAR